MSSRKQYLGDAVYADFDGFAVVLTTEDGRTASNTIVLEPEVLAALDRYREWLREPVAPSPTAEAEAREVARGELAKDIERDPHMPQDD